MIKFSEASDQIDELAKETLEILLKSLKENAAKTGELFTIDMGIMYNVVLDQIWPLLYEKFDLKLSRRSDFVHSATSWLPMFFAYFSAERVYTSSILFWHCFYVRFLESVEDEVSLRKF